MAITLLYLPSKARRNCPRRDRVRGGPLRAVLVPACLWHCQRRRGRPSGRRDRWNVDAAAAPDLAWPQEESARISLPPTATTGGAERRGGLLADEADATQVRAAIRGVVTGPARAAAQAP